MAIARLLPHWSAGPCCVLALRVVCPYAVRYVLGRTFYICCGPSPTKKTLCRGFSSRGKSSEYIADGPVCLPDAPPTESGALVSLSAQCKVAQVLYAQQLAYHSLASVGKCDTRFAHTAVAARYPGAASATNINYSLA